jgi:4-amino-4-deoxy-L-arabinose transferase-like glycosyltransferase
MLCILFGHTVYVIRLLSAVVGVLSVYYIFLVAARLFSKNAGTLLPYYFQ